MREQEVRQLVDRLNHDLALEFPPLSSADVADRTLHQTLESLESDDEDGPLGEAGLMQELWCYARGDRDSASFAALTAAIRRRIAAGNLTLTAAAVDALPAFERYAEACEAELEARTQALLAQLAAIQADDPEGETWQSEKPAELADSIRARLAKRAACLRDDAPSFEGAKQEPSEKQP